MRTLTSPLNPSIVGPLDAGHYIKLGMGLGFFVPESDYQTAKGLANATRRVQFLGVTHSGAAILAPREEILERADSAGVVAWVLPDAMEAAR